MRILRAAERLYAERGFDGASLREIAIAANQGNNNAVQYHFGSREALIDTIFHQRVAEMEAERRIMLEEAESAGRSANVPVLLAILCMPHLSLCDERGHHPHAGFMVHYLARRRPGSGGVSGFHRTFVSTSTMARLHDLIRRCVADLPADIAQTRLTLCALMFLNLLVQHDAANPERGDPVTLARHATDTLSAMASALCGPCEID